METYKREGYWNQIIDIATDLFGREWFIIHKNLIRIPFDMMIIEDRHYHSIGNHIIPFLEMIETRASINNWNQEIIEIYFWSALYHDAICDPRNVGGTNESLSKLLWNDSCVEYYPEYECRNIVSEIIRKTYGHESSTPVVREFLKMDLAGFTKDFKYVLEDELLVRKEYAFYDWAAYKKGRIEFLKRFVDNSIIKEMGVSHVLEQQASYMEFLTPNIAVYPGSFFPFHVGHMDVVLKGEAIFDKVIIAFAENAAKPCEAFINKIIPKALQGRQVEFVSGSIIKWMESLEYPVTVIRGLRNSTDLQAEQNYITWLAETSTKPFKAVTIFADKKLEHVSSSAIKHLAAVDPDKAKEYIFE